MVWRWIRTYLISPPFSAFAFFNFWSNGVVVSWFDHDGLKSHLVARFWSKFLLRTAGVRIVTHGIENIDPNGVYVVVSNHLSLADSPLIAGWLPVQFRFMGKESLARTPILGGHLRRGGHIAVPREDARGAIKSLIQATDLMKKNICVVVFPEGTRGKDPQTLQEFKGGASHLAIKAKVPVIPIAVAGTEKVMPKGVMLLRPGTIHLLVGKPIPTVDLGPQDRDALTIQMRDAVADLLKTLA